MAEVLERPKTDPSSAAETLAPEASTAPSAAQSSSAVSSKAALGLLESALTAAEDETDVAAARTVRAEAAAEMAEFDESAPIAGTGDDGGAENGGIVDSEIKRAEAELLSIEDQVMKYSSSATSLN